MELRHLRYFVAVGEALNLTRAATQLRLAQPALSRQIQDLEEEIGVDLLQRSTRGVTLTAEGKLFLEEARDVLARAEDSIRKVRALARGEYGELNIGYSPLPTSQILPPALAAFQKSTPDVKVVLHDLAGDEQVAELLAGKLELAVMVQQTGEQLAGFTFETLVQYPYVVAMPVGHRFERLKGGAVGNAGNRTAGVVASPGFFRILSDPRPDIRNLTGKTKSGGGMRRHEFADRERGIRSRRGDREFRGERHHRSAAGVSSAGGLRRVAERGDRPGGERGCDTGG